MDWGFGVVSGSVWDQVIVMVPAPGPRTPVPSGPLGFLILSVLLLKLPAEVEGIEAASLGPRAAGGVQCMGCVFVLVLDRE